MSLLTRILTSTILLLLFRPDIIVEPYGTGAPDTVCNSMEPGHGQGVQTSASPYTVRPNTTDTFGGGRVIVQIESSDLSVSPILGFFVQARDSNDVPVGSFHQTGGEIKLRNCRDGINNAATHSSAYVKPGVTLNWEAPGNFEGEVTFLTTIVQSFSIYWTGLKSNGVTVQKRSITDADKGKVDVNKPTTLGASSGIAAKLREFYDSCGDTKTCFGNKKNCVKNKNCKFMVSYTKSGSGKYEFELFGSSRSDRSYVAVGLSSDQSMGSDSVVVCSNENSVIDIYNVWNEGKRPESVVKPKKGLTVLERGEMDGKTYCRFHRNAKTKFRSTTFNLDEENYHIMVAEGNIDRNGNIQYHAENKAVSDRPVNLGDTSNLATRDTRLIRAIHGSLMIGAWICAASCGILFARYYKKTWIKFKCCNIDQWFHWHRFFMVSTWSLTIASFILIVYEFKEFRPTNHAIIGVVSVGLCFIQPIMAAFRPAPTASSRPVFNWAHWFVGNAAQILGVAAIFLGLELLISGDENWLREFAWYIIIAFIAFHCCIHLILTIAQCIGDRKPQDMSEIFPLKEYGGNHEPLESVAKIKDAPLAGFRKFVLAIYLIVNWCVTALLILIVIFKREDIERQWKDEWNFVPFWEEH